MKLSFETFNFLLRKKPPRACRKPAIFQKAYPNPAELFHGMS